MLTLPSKPVLGMILKGFPRISETFISNEILLLESLGLRIRIFSMRHPREPFTHDSVKQIRAKVDYLPTTISGHVHILMKHNLRLALKSPRPYLRALKTMGRRLVRVRKSATIKHLLQAGYLVDCLIPNSGVTHLHAHFAHSPTSVAMFAGLISGLPFSFTAHAKDIYTSDPRQLAEKIEASDFVVTCTDYNRRYLEKLSLSGAKPVHRIYHGIDVRLFGEGSLETKTQPPYRLLTVARLTAKKGLATVLRAVNILTNQGMDIRHDLIGDGDDRDSILALIDELGLKDVTTWRGTLPHRQVIEHYRAADAFVLGCEIADNGDRDGIPNVLLESMAMGVPVVATRVSAIPELIDHEMTGVLVEPGRPGDMAAAIRRVLVDDVFRRRIIHAGREHINGHFDNRMLIGQLADLYIRAGLG
jgi:glycosyltransferase involved in cell wall biosynthesis